MDTPVQELGYIVKTQVFEGPLDLLLTLIESRKLFINEISLSSITEDYARHVNEIRDRGVSSLGQDAYYEITGYLVVLATLLLIKSRSLLPNFEISTEEKVTIEDLEDRLRLYKIYKDVSKEVSVRFGTRLIYTKQPQKRDVVFIPDVRITPALMAELMKEVSTKAPTLPTVEKNPEVQVEKSISLEDVIKRIEQEVEKLSSFSFRSFAGATSGPRTYSKEEKVFTVISFLAILELIRTGILQADQDETFGDMNITKNNNILEESNE